MPTAIDVFAKVRGHEREEQLRAAREADLLPYFRRLESPAAPVVTMEGAERVMLGSNNYLGLTGDERVMAGARDALERYGTGLTGSRLLNGTIDLHLELERELAEWMGTEEAIVFTTGHQANVGCLGTLLGPGDTVIADSADHASILDGCLLGVERDVDLRMGTFSKALASCGGFIAGPHEVIDSLRISSRAFLLTAAAVPAAVGAALAALRIVRSDEGPALFASVLDNARYLREGLRSLGFEVLDDGSGATTPIVPVVVGDDWKAVVLWRALYDAGVYVNVALHPAVPPAGALLRTSVMATHDRPVLDRALEAFSMVKRSFESDHGPLPG